jgi:hypothetical protein
MNDRHFLNLFVWMIATLATHKTKTKTKSPKKTLRKPKKIND